MEDNFFNGLVVALIAIICVLVVAIHHRERRIHELQDRLNKIDAIPAPGGRRD